MKALILGVGGQDGSYLAEILLDQGWEVHGLHRRSSVDNLWRICHILDRVVLHKGDLLDLASVIDVIQRCQPDVIYNEADQDDAGWSFSNAGLAVDVTYGFVAKILAWMHLTGVKAKFFQPLSATMFGEAPAPQDESTCFDPQSPYACAKAACYDICNYYRETHSMFISTGIFYNHDSPRRGSGYLLQHIARSVVRIARGQRNYLLLGNAEGSVDIGYAGDFMQAAFSIMQLDEPDDFVVATGKLVPIRRLVDAALRAAKIDGDPDTFILTDPNYHRPDGNVTLSGNIRKVCEATHWYPLTSTEELMEALVKYHMEELS